MEKNNLLPLIKHIRKKIRKTCIFFYDATAPEGKVAYYTRDLPGLFFTREQIKEIDPEIIIFLPKNDRGQPLKENSEGEEK